MRKEKRASRSAAPFLAAVICVLIGLLVGLAVLFIINPEKAWNYGFMRILKGGFYDMPYGIGRTLTNTAPLILTGLSVGFAFKTGIFNIGVAGQYTVGAYGALLLALVFKMPWYICLLSSMLFGAVWGAIPGVFKAYLNVNEVITAIMFNWIGLYGVNEIIYRSTVMYNSAQTKTYVLSDTVPSAVIPTLGLDQLVRQKSTGGAIFLAMIIAVIIYVVLNKTTFGYELKAVGHNKNAARYAGINEKRSIILSMMIAGALAGGAAGLYYLSGAGEWNPLDSTALPAMGWNGISVALLAGSNPIGTIFSALLISHITIGGSYLPQNYFPTEIASVITGIIIYLCAFSALFQEKIIALITRRNRKDTPADTANEEGGAA